MVKGFVNYNEREDLQDDIFKLITQLFMEAGGCYVNNDARNMVKFLRLIFIFTHTRMKEDRKKYIKDTLDGIKLSLHSEVDTGEPAPLKMSRMVDELDRLMEVMSEELDRMGILLRSQADLDSLVTRK